MPDWLRTLQRKSLGQSAPVVATTLELLASAVTAAGDSEDRSPERLKPMLLPILPLLGPGPGILLRDALPEWLDACLEARPALFEWLRESLGVEPIAPGERAPFEAERMEVAGERRTAHPLEQGTVAKLERVGLVTVDGQVLFPARVVRYEFGGAD